MCRNIFNINCVLALVVGAMTYDFNDLDTLGDRISAHVQRELAPLQNLGSRISAKVHEDLQPLQNQRYHQGIAHRGWYNVNPQIPFLDNLGQMIQQNVHQGLEPVRAMEITFKMKGGVGGTTIATYLPEDKKFVIKNNLMYQCQGTISEEDGQCNGSLTPFEIKERKDYCYIKTSYSIVNNYICIGANTVSMVNNEITCRSNSGPPALLLSLDEFNKLCQGSAERVNYKYIANPLDLAHVEIPNRNKYVKCSNNQPGVCVFTESQPLPHSSGNIVITNSFSN